MHVLLKNMYFKNVRHVFEKCTSCICVLPCFAIVYIFHNGNLNKVPRSYGANSTFIFNNNSFAFKKEGPRSYFYNAYKSRDL